MSPVTLTRCIQLLCLVSFVACQYGKYWSNSYDKQVCKADANEPWSYSGKNGPEFWGYRYPSCDGKEQSPIAINSHKAIKDHDLHKLLMKNYDIPITDAVIENNGRSVEISPRDGVDRTIYVGDSTYRLEQLHFHFGEAYYCGAEHTLDGDYYSMEMHLVHQNANGENTVVAVLYEESNKMNREFQSIIKSFPKILYKDDRASLVSPLKLENLLPANPSSYYRYDGSLTTPECTEGVPWSVLTKPVPVGKKQMAEFRKLYSARKEEATEKCKLFNNYRPIQPLNGRHVFRSE